MGKKKYKKKYKIKSKIGIKILEVNAMLDGNKSPFV